MTQDDTQARIAKVPFAALDRYADLFRTYCTDYPSLSDFFSGDFRDSQSIEDAAARAAAFSRDRETLVSVLKRQNEHWGARERSLHNISRLLDPQAVAVVTGQQVGLLTGPLYTILKTITAVQVARQLEAETGRPFIPVFWLEGEDHDVAEATSITIPTDEGPVQFSYDPPKASGGLNAGPVGRLRLDDRFTAFLGEVENALQPSEFRDGIMKAVTDSYETGETLLCGFARYMRKLFPDEGLVFISPDDAELKHLLSPLFRRELEDHAGSNGALKQATERLDSKYASQINPRPGNLFLLHEKGRVKLEPENGSFHLRGLDQHVELHEAVDMLNDEPSRFSPNVALRPLAQDTLLPTAVYVAGPGEIAYFAQLKGLYEWAGIPMPVIYPRASATFVEKRIRRVLDRYELDLERISGDINEVIRDVVLTAFEVDLDGAFSETEHSVASAFDGLKPLVERIDASLSKSVDATRAGIVKQIENLKERTVRSGKRQQDQIREAIQRAGHHLFPDGHLQERTVSPLYIMTKYGPELPVRWISELSTDTTGHQIVEID
ncbi:MAG TPA: bacillithiol biosynthesis cysteine-adding enzyme BshC [Rhodothermales bacterium]